MQLRSPAHLQGFQGAGAGECALPRHPVRRGAQTCPPPELAFTGRPTRQQRRLHDLGFGSAHQTNPGKAMASSGAPVTKCAKGVLPAGGFDRFRRTAAPIGHFTLTSWNGQRVSKIGCGALPYLRTRSGCRQWASSRLLGCATAMRRSSSGALSALGPPAGGLAISLATSACARSLSLFQARRGRLWPGSQPPAALPLRRGRVFHSSMEMPARLIRGLAETADRQGAASKPGSVEAAARTLAAASVGAASAAPRQRGVLSECRRRHRVAVWLHRSAPAVRAFVIQLCNCICRYAASWSRAISSVRRSRVVTRSRVKRALDPVHPARWTDAGIQPRA